MKGAYSTVWRADGAARAVGEGRQGEALLRSRLGAEPRASVGTG